MNTKTYLILICFCFLSLAGRAQSPFGVAIVGGANISQMTGDAAAGFRKIGLHGGLKATIDLSYRTELGIGIQYDQRGSRNNVTSNNSGLPFTINLDYVNVPITYSFMDWFDEEDAYYKVHFTGGLVYGRLFRKEQDGERLAEECLNNLRENDLSWMLGASYFWTPNWGFTFYHQRAILDANDGLGPCVQDLRPYQWTFRLEYKF